MTRYEEAFRAHQREAADCAVLALASVTGHTYLQAHHAMQVAGRKKATGTPDSKTLEALQFLGFRVVRVWSVPDIALETRTKKPALADLEGKDWLPRMLVFVNRGDHIAPFFNGHVHDWSANTEATIDKAWEVTKVGVPAKRKTPPIIYL